MQALIFLVFLIILQQLEGNIIYPKVVGNSIGLPGIWVLAAVTVGGGLGGIMGMLIGVPCAATAYKLVFEHLETKEDKLGIKPIEEKSTEPKKKNSLSLKKMVEGIKKTPEINNTAKKSKSNKK